MIEPIAARYIAQSRSSDDVIARLREINDQGRATVEDFGRFPDNSWSFHRSLVEGTNNRTLGVLFQLIADIVELAIFRKYSRAMTEAEAREQATLNRRSVKANDRLLKLLEARDAEGAEAYWTRHMIAVAETLIGADQDAVIDLPL
jgi:DNA-binding FadR family transcriptional regulator